ncbi:hypothetical protein H257_12147 [Aphanomyces astaci]|uniref:Uncharacterized protein n=1 Tax=Aphanomyces astaci TaxID=112090 RepID=W4G163_APHAT|nr:hypothetical protein H257_12147 [Aphanomyces astaci]ETV72779.1 hypothetical protein H257_12147 [Aphanomyces astaci]|eukprot:XP_009837565.1 hypothetical protein H257_12147 [Aphanomyces astaci]
MHHGRRLAQITLGRDPSLGWLGKRRRHDDRRLLGHLLLVCQHTCATEVLGLAETGGGASHGQVARTAHHVGATGAFVSDGAEGVVAARTKVVAVCHVIVRRRNVQTERQVEQPIVGVEVVRAAIAATRVVATATPRRHNIRALFEVHGIGDGVDDGRRRARAAPRGVHSVGDGRRRWRQRVFVDTGHAYAHGRDAGVVVDRRQHNVHLGRTRVACDLPAEAAVVAALVHTELGHANMARLTDAVANPRGWLRSIAERPAHAARHDRVLELEQAQREALVPRPPWQVDEAGFDE